MLSHVKAELPKSGSKGAMDHAPSAIRASPAVAASIKLCVRWEWSTLESGPSTLNSPQTLNSLTPFVIVAGFMRWDFRFCNRHSGITHTEALAFPARASWWRGPIYLARFKPCRSRVEGTSFTASGRFCPGGVRPMEGAAVRNPGRGEVLDRFCP